MIEDLSTILFALAIVLALVVVFVSGYFAGRSADRRRRSFWAKYRL
jgi:hypothetical protein